MTAPHSLRYVRNDRGIWRARCSCGWRSGKHFAEPDAEMAGRHHAAMTGL